MSRPRFLADHNFNDNIIEGVARKEPLIEIVKCREVGLERSPDDEILSYAAENGFIVLTHDVNTMADFAYQRLTKGEHIQGLFLVIQDRPIGPIIENLILVWSITDAEEWQDRVRFLPV